ncbi:Sapep family Mn(2+)-dependent dipeptidase [Clostridium sp. Marseille-P2415]|uniref:Sapep family Mn(2+)-dependent dipeptidase n=1 Tax=Clostridium sp. Marseille-P2415 TaxID=1805471 RepID=UPI000988499A|nr:Sapep family Mn(2+)-dependent dipeptidase [Clostridium sp. Marseille-P2415]
MYKKEIEAYIESHKQEMIEDICTLCRINSEKMPYREGMPYGPGAFEALNEALSMAESYGFSITNYDNYVGTADLNVKEHQLDILAHLDVVPAGEGWKETEPFEPVVKGDKLFGRGTADDKGPAVAALYAMRAVKELNIPLKKNVRLILGTDEECGSSDIAHYYAIEKEAPMTFSPDGAFPVVNTEKGGLNGHFTAEWTPSGKLPRLVSINAGIKVNVVPGKANAVVAGVDEESLSKAAAECEKKTGIRFEPEWGEGTVSITAIGESAHASIPGEGNNALTGLLVYLTELPLAECEQMTMIRRLLELIPHGDTSGKALGIAMGDEISGDLTLAFSLLKVTDSGLEGTFDSRCPICATEENVLEVVRKNMAEKGFTLHNDSMRPPHHVDGNSEFVKTLLRAYEDYTGRKGACVSMGGGTYVHELKNGVAFGAAMPETDNRMHGADEYAVIEELVVSAKIFAQVIVDLCS